MFRATGRPECSLALDSFRLFRLNCFERHFAQDLCHGRRKGARISPIPEPGERSVGWQRAGADEYDARIVSSLDELSCCCPFWAPRAAFPVSLLRAAPLERRAEGRAIQRIFTLQAPGE